jgi:hypothetical protein
MLESAHRELVVIGKERAQLRKGAYPDAINS